MYKVDTHDKGTVAILFTHTLNVVEEDRPKGLTICNIKPVLPDGNLTNSGAVSGTSACSHEDNFDRKKGRKIALLRAISALDRNNRKRIMEGYFSQRRGIGDF